MDVRSLCDVPGLILTVLAKNRFLPFLPVCFIEVLEDLIVGFFWLGVMGNHGSKLYQLFFCLGNFS